MATAVKSVIQCVMVWESPLRFPSWISPALEYYPAILIHISQHSMLRILLPTLLSQPNRYGATQEQMSRGCEGIGGNSLFDKFYGATFKGAFKHFVLASCMDGTVQNRMGHPSGGSAALVPTAVGALRSYAAYRLRAWCIPAVSSHSGAPRWRNAPRCARVS